MKKLLLLSALAFSVIASQAVTFNVTVMGEEIQNGATVDAKCLVVNEDEFMGMHFVNYQLDPEVYATASEPTEVSITVTNHFVEHPDGYPNLQFCWPIGSQCTTPGYMGQPNPAVRQGSLNGNPQLLFIDTSVWDDKIDEAFTAFCDVEIRSLANPTDSFSFSLNLIYDPEVLGGGEDPNNSYDFKAEGIYYNILDKTKRTLEVTRKNNSDYYSGIIQVPEIVRHLGIDYSVVAVGDSAFAGSTEMVSVSLPKSVQKLGDYSFSDCKSLTSIELPNLLTMIGNSAFKDCSKLTSITIPEGVVNISDHTFEECTGLQKVVLKNSIERIGDYAFYRCENLTSINIPDKVSSIGNYAFYSCKALPSFAIPSSLVSIEIETFGYCKNLKTITIPSSIVEIKQNAFVGCENLEEVNITDLAAWCSISFSDNPLQYAKWLKLNGNNITEIEIPETVTTIGNNVFKGYKALSYIALHDNVEKIGNGAFWDCSGLSSIELPISLISIGDKAFYGCSGIKSLTIPNKISSLGEAMFSACTINPLVLLSDVADLQTFNGIDPSSIVYCSPLTYSKLNGKTPCTVYPLVDVELVPLIFGLKFKLAAHKTDELNWGDISDVIVQVTIKNNKGNVVKELQTELDKECYIDGLDSNSKYSVTFVLSGTPYNLISTQEFTTVDPIIKIEAETTQTKIKIKSIMPSSDASVSPSGCEVMFNNEIYPFTGKELVFQNLQPDKNYDFVFTTYYGEEKVERVENISTKSIDITLKNSNVGPTTVVLEGSYSEGDAVVSNFSWGENIEGNHVYISGLNPATEYTYFFTITTDKGYKYSKPITFTTQKLELSTLQPQCPTSTSANVAASTNISENETGAGFQWKKYDAPETLNPSEGYAIIFDGRLEGQIKNLQTTSFYNVRAFYKSADGVYYYGEWVTFDPSDFSYFDPTVRTYGSPEVNENTVTLRGIVLSGSDPVLSQGFQYWITKGSNVKKTSNGEIFTLLATGQVMTATVNDLEDGVYTFRSFVETSNGSYYGEEQIFRIETSGVENIENIGYEVEIVGYYNLKGVKFNKPQKGLNIVLYNDGSSKKIFVKE